ncbi:hypothetical protein MLD38_013185 [Melastoma candidum]|uniref:Uncharacterized protein n=1 Tax=Melastoma candidum TaxID=119954 RepID=A0ACB9R858_9MYRT|nr:hypothetical protein MLD38_013185 [Melastoma candidum]
MVSGSRFVNVLCDRGKVVLLKISDTWRFLRPSSPFFAVRLRPGWTVMKQNLVPSLAMLTRPSPWFPKQFMIPQGTAQAFTFEMRYLSRSSLLTPHGDEHSNHFLAHPQACIYGDPPASILESELSSGFTDYMACSTFLPLVGRTVSALTAFHPI